MFEDQQCRLFYYNSHSDFAPLGYASLIMHVTYYSGTSLLRAVCQFFAYENRGGDPASFLGKREGYSQSERPTVQVYNRTTVPKKERESNDSPGTVPEE